MPVVPSPRDGEMEYAVFSKADVKRDACPVGESDRDVDLVSEVMCALGEWTW